MFKNQNQKLLLGAHVSISGGLKNSIARAESIGCNVMQIFSKSNRQWAAKPIEEYEANLFKEALKKSNIEFAVVHASYLINASASMGDIYNKSMSSLIEELQRCQQLNIPYLVLHPGSNANCAEGQKNIAANINQVFEKVPGNSMILLENMAGMGNCIGKTFEQLARIIDSIRDKNRIGICFDTCHAFAGGYNFNTSDSYENMWKLFDNTIGLNFLKAMHINDSKSDCGSQIDRHAHIGQGKIDINGFQMLFNDSRFFGIPKILETPIENDEKDFIPDIKKIVNLISSDNQSLLSNTSFGQYLTDAHKN